MAFPSFYVMRSYVRSTRSSGFDVVSMNCITFYPASAWDWNTDKQKSFRSPLLFEKKNVFGLALILKPGFHNTARLINVLIWLCWGIKSRWIQDYRLLLSFLFCQLFIFDFLHSLFQFRRKFRFQSTGCSHSWKFELRLAVLLIPCQIVSRKLFTTMDSV